jgi:hypothetical protein
MSLRYTFQLKPERDSDLIAWLNSLGEGERSCFIRHALRKTLNLKEEAIINNKAIPNASLLTSTKSLSIDSSSQGINTDQNDPGIENKLNQLAKIF